MLIPSSLRTRIEAHLGSELSSVRRESGGCINAAASFNCGDHTYFLKWNGSAPPGLFAAEADGLGVLSGTSTLSVPDVIAFAEAEADRAAYILLSHFGSASRRGDYWERLGQGLAMQHRSTGHDYGHQIDNFIGTLAQKNAMSPSWVEFFGEERLLAQVHIGVGSGVLGTACASAVERLVARLGELIPESPESSCLHGDLWGGNVAVNRFGAPVIYDPAVYYGHREVELAFTELFGGFSPAFYAAYDDAWPLDPGYAERRDLYNLYPVLVHANLFGGEYEHQALSTANRYL